MNDATQMCGMNGTSQYLRQSGRMAGELRSSRSLARQRPSIYIFQRAVGKAALRTDFKNLNDVGMFQPGDCLGLGSKTRELRSARVGAAQNHLQGHQAIEVNL